MFFISKLRPPRPPQVRPIATAPHLRQPLRIPPDLTSKAYTHWITAIQTELFPSEIQLLKQSKPIATSSPLSAFVPYLDEHSVMRARGRLNRADIPFTTKHPNLMNSHPLVDAMIKDIHLNLLHAGPQLVLAKLRESVWLLRGRQNIRRILWTCVTCERERAESPSYLMGDLPDCRVNRPVRPFLHAGIDYAGPFQVRTTKGRGHKSTKAYIAIFMCMAVRAVHIELVSDYSSASFLAAFRRFVARRGCPQRMYSDNGTNFHGADRELREAYSAATSSCSFLKALADDKIAWHFIPPAAPNFGGLWEAAVKSVKTHLKRCMKSYTLTYEEFSTLLSQIEACLNSRPLISGSDSLDDYTTLTPAHFLIGTTLTGPVEPRCDATSLPLRERWQMCCRIVQDVWKSWQQDYLHSLQKRSKGRINQPSDLLHRLVVVRNPALPPTYWLLGRVVQCHPGDDGVVRVVTIKTSSATLTLPLSKICVLPVDPSPSSPGDKAPGITATTKGATTAQGLTSFAFKKLELTLIFTVHVSRTQ